MHPLLLEIGSFRIYTYGVFLALAFWTALMVAKNGAKHEGLDPEVMNDLFLYILISAIVGSRVFYVATTFEEYIRKPLDMFKLWEGGLVFYGGFIAAALTAVFYVKKRRMPVSRTADAAAPAVAFGHFMGRLGCFFAGCCYGKSCDLPWAVTFENPDSLAPLGVPLHPTQLYSAFNNLIVFGILIFFRKRKKFHGQLFFLYILLYGLTRSFIEYFRDDFRGTMIGGLLSPSQANLKVWLRPTERYEGVATCMPPALLSSTWTSTE